MKDFFISYNKADRGWAEWIAWQLDAVGYKTVIQAWDFVAGSNFVLEMHKASIETQRTIVVLSQDFLDAEYTQPEWAAAFVDDPGSKDGRLVPIRVGDCKPPGLLKGIVFVDLVGKEETAARQELLGLIEGVLKRAKGERPLKPSTAPGFPGSRGNAVPQFPGSVSTTPVARAPGTFQAPRLDDLLPSRSPIVIAIEHAGAPIADADLRAVERHLTVTLSDAQFATLVDLATQEKEAKPGLAPLVTRGERIWKVLHEAQPRLQSVLKTARDSVNPQPVAWTGSEQLLAQLHRALLIARFPGIDGPGGFLSVAFGDHYFNPLPHEGAQRRVQARVSDRPRTRIITEKDHSADADRRVALAAASRLEIAVLCVAQRDAGLTTLSEAVTDDRASACRAALAFGEGEVSPEVLRTALARIPCVSLGGSVLQEPVLAEPLAESIASVGGRLAVPSVIAAYRRAWINHACEARDEERAASGLYWTTWSWLGRPLFATDFGEAVPASYPHLTDLRSVTSKDSYFNRRKGIQDLYQAEALLTEGTPDEKRFHLYLSGGGGTGKSCFLRYLYEKQLEKPGVLPVWYRVDAPSSEWENVQRRIKEETVRAVRLKDRDTSVLPPMQQSLGEFLRQLVTNLRKLDPPINEVAVYIDQLERTFESGDEPDFNRLETISNEVVALLKSVKDEPDVRVFIASRKQYLPDFLRSYQDAFECRLQFNVLQSISDRVEQGNFVEKVRTWCRDQELIDKSLVVDKRAAEMLAGRVDGHPLNMMLALIQLFSAAPPARVTEETLELLRPWEKLFHFDLQIAAKDDIDWFFLLAMSSARTEIVRFEEVWWRLRLVKATLTRSVEELGPKGVLERLWLLGHLGRTIHARPDDRDPARFLEFFHANLRDYLLRDVMSYGGAELGIPGRTGGTPPAWRALDRLAAAARDWEQTQQVLPPDDVRVLMEHRHVVVERVKKDEEPERDPFYLLFLRDAERSRKRLCLGARECLVFSALVHDDFGRWAFDQLVPDPAEKIECCRRWLSRTPAHQHRLRLIQTFVEIEAPDVRAFLADLILAEEAPFASLWREIADVLAEPLNAARYRNEVISGCLDRIVEGSRSTFSLPERLGRFVVAACDGARNDVLSVLAYCADRAEGAADSRLKQYADDLRSNKLVEQWFQDEEVRGLEPRSTREVAGRAPARIQLVAGNVLKEAVDATFDREGVARLSRALGIPLPEIEIRSGELQANEVELRLAGQRVTLGQFYPGRCQILKRHWDRTQTVTPADAIVSYNEALQEGVLWVERDYLTHVGWEQQAQQADTAMSDWIERELRRNLELFFDFDVLIDFVRDIAEIVDVSRVFRSVSLPLLRRVLINLVQERVPIASRRIELMEELEQLINHVDSVDVLTQKLREYLAAEIGQAFSGESERLATILLEEGFEEYLVTQLQPTEDGDYLRLSPAQALALASATRRHVERSLRDDDALPVVVSVPTLRRPLFRLLRRFDRRIYALSFTELAPALRLSVAGQVASLSASGGGHGP
jgi:hypothetical protein